jgi:hypothetical protein
MLPARNLPGTRYRLLIRGTPGRVPPAGFEPALTAPEAAAAI